MAVLEGEGSVRRRVCWLGLGSAIAMASVLIIYAPIRAEAASRLDTTKYVRVVKFRNGQWTLGLTAAGRRRLTRYIGGKFLDGRCVRLRRNPTGITEVSGSANSRLIAGAHGRIIYQTLLDHHADYCDVGLARVSDHGRTQTSLPGTIDSVPLTQRGAEYLAEDQVAANSYTILETAQRDQITQPAGRFPSAASLVRAINGAHAWGKVVVLKSPSDDPPRGTTGVYSNGDDDIAIVTISPYTQRLFIDQAAGDFSTNIEEHILRFLTGQLPSLPGS